MKYTLCFIVVVCSMMCHASLCKPILGNKDVDNRRVYQIQKDVRGFMWFLTTSGVNRYDGKNLKKYLLQVDGNAVDGYMHHCVLYADSRRNIGVVTGEGYLLTYRPDMDRFELLMDCSKYTGNTFRFLSLDAEDNLWFCNDERLFAYHIPTATVHVVGQPFLKISGWMQITPTYYCLSSAQGLFRVGLRGYSVVDLSTELSGGGCAHINYMYYHPLTRQLFFTDGVKGLYSYGWDNGRIDFIGNSNEVGAKVNCMRAWKGKEILIATDGAGIRCLDAEKGEIKPYLSADAGNNYALNSNRIADLFVDETKRLWIADYPDGVRMKNAALQDGCRWYRHLAHNKQSLINNRVNAVVYDSQGDIWFATDDGVCLYDPGKNSWKEVVSGLSSNLFTSLCELDSGRICAANYIHGIYCIQKDKLLLDKQYSDFPAVKAVAVRDKERLWLGTEKGLYSLDRRRGIVKPVSISVTPISVRALYQDSSGILYIGTSGKGVVAYEPITGAVFLYQDKRIRNVETILPKRKGQLLVGADGALFRFIPEKRHFQQLTYPIGPVTSGAALGNRKYILGTSEGALEMDGNYFPAYRKRQAYLYLDNFSLFHQEMVPGKKDSPLKKAINETSVLRLKHDQNTFSFTATFIDYDEISDIAYTWKLNGMDWTPPTAENKIYFSNLRPGKYQFSVRAVSLGSGNPLMQRNMQIHIAPPGWKTNTAFLFYGLVLLMLGTLVMRALLVWRERNLSREKIKMFINTIHSISTPLEMIKAPLENLYEESSSETLRNVLHQVEEVDHVLADVAEIESTSSGKGEYAFREYELSGYLKSVVEDMKPLAQKKKIRLCWKEEPGFVSVWLHRGSMNSVLRGLFCLFIEHMDPQEDLLVSACCADGYWKIIWEARESGNQEKKGFYFSQQFTRNSAHVIGWSLIKELVRLHKGKLVVHRKREKKVSVTLSFPIVLKSEKSIPQVESVMSESITVDMPDSPAEDMKADTGKRIVLVVEENEELRACLVSALENNYMVETCPDGESALESVEEKPPHIIVSNASLPELDGKELCTYVKTNKKIAHVPIILFMTPAEEDDDCYRVADYCFVMPFNISLLKIEIDNLITNREILKKKYLSMLVGKEEEDWDLDQEKISPAEEKEFMEKVDRLIEENMSDVSFGVDKLNTMMSMSRSTMYNRFRKFTRMAPSSYIRMARMKKSLDLLLTGKYTIAEIADITGFGDSKYFSEVFKKNYGEAPTKFLNNL